MAYVQPDKVVESMIQAGAKKAKLSASQLVLRGAVAGGLLGYATTLALTAIQQTGTGMVGALIFPVGFVIIILLGMELVTGNFALIPLAVKEKKATVAQMLNNWCWVIVGHLIGCAAYAVLFGIAITKFGNVPDQPLAQMIIGISEAKTLGYKELGGEGYVTVFVKAMLCNWFVTLGAVMAMTSQSTIGKILAMWLPIFAFFGQGFEHAVVNMFVIPAGMMLGADVSFADWWWWNQIPVTLGNLFSGVLFTGMALYWMHRKSPADRVAQNIQEAA